jgi:DNA (cytosine-5)-methyltransferase 1
VKRPRILDLFCGGGGAAMGYSRAGFEVVGVDIQSQPRYPFKFIRADCLDLDAAFVASFDAVHASPPCQHFSPAARLHGNREDHPDLVIPTRAMLAASGLPTVIENVVGAPIRQDLLLCGTMFGLRIVKHRQFECSFPVFSLLPTCDHADVYDPWHGKGRSAEQFRQAQDTPWLPCNGGASRKRGDTGDLSNAIPPAYTRFIGTQLLAHIRASSLEAA